MSDSQFTRCPGCATVYRVTATQLALREGQVRCGHCRAVFDATAQLVDLTPAMPGTGASPSAGGEDDELARGRPTVTLRDARALEPTTPLDPERVEAEPERVEPEPESIESEPESIEPEPESIEPEPESIEPEPESIEQAAEPNLITGAPLDVAELEAARAALRPRRRRARSGNTFYAIAILLLVAGLAVQSIALFRDEIAERAPWAILALDAFCRSLVCRTGPLRDAGSLSIEGSDLQADPAHRGLLVLTATLRNRAVQTVAWPDLELTLTDSSDQAVARRVFAPHDYLPTATARTGLDAHSEHPIRLFLDASATRSAGYRLYLFYP